MYDELEIKKTLLEYLNKNITKNIVEIHREEILLEQLSKKIIRYHVIHDLISLKESISYDNGDDIQYEDLVHPTNVEPLSLAEFNCLEPFAIDFTDYHVQKR